MGCTSSKSAATLNDKAALPPQVCRTENLKSATSSVGNDMLGFRHIVTSILDYADPKSVVAFRAASRQCLELADARLFRHIIFNDSDLNRSPALGTDPQLPWPGQTPVARLEIHAPHGRLPCAPWSKSDKSERARLASRLSHARVLDYHCEFDAATEPMLASALAGVKVIRRVWPSATVLPAPTVIDYLDLSVAGYWSAPGIANRQLPKPTIHPLPAGVHRAVINVVYSTRLGDYNQHVEFGNMRGADIVLKFLPRAQVPSRSPYFDLFRDQPTTMVLNGPKPYGFLGGLLTQLGGVMQTSSVTWVGLSDVPAPLLGIASFFPADRLQSLIAMGITMCHNMEFVMGQGWWYADRETAMAAWRTLGRLHFLSKEKYAAQMTAALGPPDAVALLRLEDVPPTGDVARLWIPAAQPPPSPPIPVDEGSSPDRFYDETVRCLQTWKRGFDDKQFGSGNWGEPC